MMLIMIRRVFRVVWDAHTAEAGRDTDLSGTVTFSFFPQMCKLHDGYWLQFFSRSLPPSASTSNAANTMKPFGSKLHINWNSTVFVMAVTDSADML